MYPLHSLAVNLAGFHLRRFAETLETTRKATRQQEGASVAAGTQVA